MPRRAKVPEDISLHPGYVCGVQSAPISTSSRSRSINLLWICCMTQPCWNVAQGKCPGGRLKTLCFSWEGKSKHLHSFLKFPHHIPDFPIFNLWEILGKDLLHWGYETTIRRLVRGIAGNRQKLESHTQTKLVRGVKGGVQTRLTTIWNGLVVARLPLGEFAWAAVVSVPCQLIHNNGDAAMGSPKRPKDLSSLSLEKLWRTFGHENKVQLPRMWNFEASCPALQPRLLLHILWLESNRCSCLVFASHYTISFHVSKFWRAWDAWGVSFTRFNMSCLPPLPLCMLLQYQTS